MVPAVMFGVSRLSPPHPPRQQESNLSMIRSTTGVLLSLGLCVSAASAAERVPTGELDLGLQEVLEATAPNEVVSALVFLRDQPRIDALRAAHDRERAAPGQRRRETVTLLHQTAAETQGDFLLQLEALHAAGLVESYRPFWIANMVQVDAPADILRGLAMHRDVERLYANLTIGGIAPVALDEGFGGAGAADGGVAGGSPEIGLTAIRAPEAWALGYTGAGTLIASLDSGVDGNHPALGSRWRGLDPAYAGNPGWAWFDPVTNTTFPTEFLSNSHGTHTMGTAAGGAPGDSIGVAHAAQWIHAAVIDRVSIPQTVADAILAFQWIINPDGDPGSGFGIPDVCFNSWGVTANMGYPACDDLFWSFIDNAEAVGVVMIFAAGNEGVNGLRRPADRATTEYRNLAVGAVNAADPSFPIASFSSRGPTNCTIDGSSAIKPDISAPGVGVRSAVNGGGYNQLNGTSMAAPHIAGVAALIRQACPTLAPDEVMQIMYDTAVDLGAPGKDSVYGHGLVDALESVLLAEALCSFGLTIPSGTPSLVPPGEPISFVVRIIENNESLLAGSAQVLYRYDASEPFQSAPLVPQGGELFLATVPAANCGDAPEYYVSAESVEGTVRTMPFDAPAELYSSMIGELVQTEIFAADFNGGLPAGWSASGQWNVTGNCVVGSSTCDGAPGAQWAYYGSSSSCNHSGTGSGTLSSPPLQLPVVGPSGEITVRFCYNKQSGVFAGGSFSFGSLTQSLPDSGQWTTRNVDVTAFSGQTHPLQWTFSNSWPFGTNARGLQVNAVTVEATIVACEPVVSIVGDLNGDGVVDGADLGILLSNWGACASCGDCPADLNGDCIVDGSDLGLLLENWS